MNQQQEWTEDRVRLALVQKLESLHRSGVQQIPKLPPRAPAVLTKPTTAAPNERQSPGIASGHQETLRKQQIATPPTGKSPPSPATDTPLDPVSALSLLQREVVRCSRCDELARKRTQTVFGIGNPRARLCFLGEAPGADEDRLGEPFVGPAGQLLTKIIQACTLSREEVYILNVLKCRPPGNRNPEADEVANCRGYFEQQLEIIRPEFICCLGAIAAQSLLRTTQAVGRLRGKFHDYRGIQVLVTYHPSYLLRQPEMKREVWEDMKLLMKTMGLEVPGRK